MSTKIYIRLANERVNTSAAVHQQYPAIFTPGEVITPKDNFMRGHGTYEDNDNLIASVAGMKEQVNNLISVRPLKSRYLGEIGDVVVGRITEVQQKRWKVDTNSRLDSILLLSSVNLPGGELRRRSVEDQHMMRQYLQEGDLVSAEVHRIDSDGYLMIHTRSLKYGKLSQGVLVKIFPSLIKRSKTHFHNLPIGASVIIGNNGFIWISSTINPADENAGSFMQDLNKVIPRDERETIARIRNCILALSQSKIMIYDTTILYAYEESLKYPVSHLLVPEAMVDIALLTQQRLHMHEND